MKKSVYLLGFVVIATCLSLFSCSYIMNTAFDIDNTLVQEGKKSGSNSSSNSGNNSSTSGTTQKNTKEVYTPKTENYSSYKDLEYSYITSTNPKQYTVSVKGGTIYSIVFANSYANYTLLSEAGYNTYAYDACISAEDSSDHSVLYTSISSTSTTSQIYSCGTLFLKPEKDDVYTITISTSSYYSYSSDYYSGYVGFYLYEYFTSPSSNYTLKESEPETADDFTYAYITSDNPQTYKVYLTEGNIYCMTITSSNCNSKYISTNFSTDTLASNPYISVTDVYGYDVNMYKNETGGDSVTKDFSNEKLYLLPAKSGTYIITQSTYDTENSYYYSKNSYNGFVGLHVYTYLNSSTLPYTLSASFDPYENTVNFVISTKSPANSAYISYSYKKSNATSSKKSYGTNIASQSSYSTTLTPDSSYSTEYTFYIVDIESYETISNIAVLNIPKQPELYKLKPNSNSYNYSYNTPTFILSSDYEYASNLVVADMYRKSFTIGSTLSTSTSGYTKIGSTYSTTLVDYSATSGELYAYYAANSLGSKISNFTLGSPESIRYTARTLSSNPQYISQYQVVDIKKDYYTSYMTTLEPGTYYLSVADSNFNNSLLSDYSDAAKAKVYVYKYDGTLELYYYNSYYKGYTTTVQSFTVSEAEVYYIVCTPYSSSTTSGTCAFCLFTK